ncbi:MAG: hypothetical protein AAGL23_07125 [Pseudomonadota bacterium]
MSSIRTWAVTFIFALCMQAQAAERLELSEIIASCTGRLSAEMEFAWLMGDPDADALETHRAHFVAILESLGPGPDPHRQMALRIETKMAHSRLLTTAYFGQDAARATWAKRQAFRQRSICENLLLDS